MESTLGNDNSSETVTICQALRKKYCPAMFEYDINHMQISPKKQDVILQQRNHEKRVCLMLDGCQIDSAGKEGEIEETCPLIQELDLSNNFLHDLIQIRLIADQLKHLNFINLSHNPLKNASITDACFTNGTTYPSVRKLILNNTGVQFDTLQTFLGLFPKVHELHVSLNQYGEVPKLDFEFHSLESLHFSKNEILQWEDIEHLGDIFPDLQTLIICENPIEDIPLDSALEKHFPVLEKLSIAKTLISDWRSLDQLRRIPRLSDIRFSRIPLLESYEDDTLRRQLLIARLPNMRVMNGGLIQDSEREDAERAFIRYYKRDDEKPTRYSELIKIHGELYDLVEVNLEKPKYVVIILKGDINSPPRQMKLDLDKKTIEFRKYLAQSYNLSLSKFRVIYHGIGIPEEMKISSKRLYTYHIKEGDCIELQRLDIVDFA